MFAKLLANQDKMQAQIERIETHNKMLENKIAQQAESSTRLKEIAGSTRARAKEHINAVTLRSGKELEDLDEEVPKPQTQKVKEVGKEKDELKPYTPPIPFPQRLKKKSNDKQFSKFADMMRKLYVTLPFTEVITQAPSYARFLKGHCYVQEDN
ncbi:unnamed protein product [Rhodiola kirilowii]